MITNHQKAETLQWLDLEVKKILSELNANSVTDGIEKLDSQK